MAVLHRFYCTPLGFSRIQIVNVVLCVIQDELINHVVLPHMCHIENDGDVAVRKCAVEILLSLAQTCSPVCFIDLVDIVEKVRLQYEPHHEISNNLTF